MYYTMYVCMITISGVSRSYYEPGHLVGPRAHNVYGIRVCPRKFRALMCAFWYILGLDEIG